MDEHAATADLAQKANECPFFQRQGCPFAKHASFDSSVLKTHPAFAAGCPYKGVDIHKLQQCPAFKDHKCPFDGTHPVDLSKIDQCPAFKDGCPYSKLAHKHEKHDHENLTEHSATEHIAAEAMKCPVFAHSNCPFDPKHPHALDLSKVTLCPAFQRSGGCPFKAVHVERLKECPAFKDGKCPFNGTKEIDLSRIEKCPAFQKGCPYSSLHSQAGETESVHKFALRVSSEAHRCPIFSQANGGCPYDPSHLRSMDLSKIKECPAFKAKGCPYKNIHLERIHECPAFKDGKCPFDKTSVDLSKLKECPAFSNGCPYKASAAPEKASAATVPPSAASASAAPAPASSASAASPGPAPQAHPEGAQCPFAHMHGKVDNPHK